MEGNFDQGGPPQKPQPDFQGEKNAQGSQIAHEGVKSIIGEMRGLFSEQQNKDLDDKVSRVMDSELPTAEAVETAVNIQDNKEKILFLAVFSEKSIEKALADTEHDSESSDRYAGFLMDSLGQMVARETEKRQGPPQSGQ